MRTIYIKRIGLPFILEDNGSLMPNRYSFSFDVGADGTLYVLSGLDAIALDRNGSPVSQFSAYPGLTADKARELIPSSNVRGAIKLAGEGKIPVTTGDMFDEPWVLVFDKGGNQEKKLTSPGSGKLSMIVAGPGDTIYLPDDENNIHVYDSNLSYITTISCPAPTWPSTPRFSGWQFSPTAS